MTVLNPFKTIRKFWTQPVRAELVAAFRISIGLIVLLDTSFTLLPYAGDWFGAEGLYPVDSFRYFVARDWRWSLIDPGWSVTTLQLLLGLLIACAAFTTVGLLTRVATVGMWVLLVSFHMRNPVILNGGDVLLRSTVFLLMLMPAGASWSLDNVIRRRLLAPVQPGAARKLLALPFTHAAYWGEVLRGESSTGWVRPWSLRLAQIQLCVVYFFTGVDKLRGINFVNGTYGDWAGGHAVFKALNHGTISRFAVFGDLPWWLFAPATWITLGWEIAFPLLVLWRRTRWYSLSFGVLLHVGIWATMEVTHFSFTIMAFYWLFVPAVILMDMAGKATGSSERRKYLLFYDGMCPICKKSQRTVRCLDWLKRFEFADVHDRTRAEAELPEVTYGDMLKEMYVKRPDGKWFGGYDAFRAMAPVLPLCWPLVPFMWLPGARFIGKRVYKWVARNRYKYAKCDDEFCSLHLKLLAGNEVNDEVVAKIVDLHQKYKSSQQAPATG
ncbi:MAG: DCC1-like thiol-disulfide oxidoreductase family protein [Planctomycetes bacterium]|nr:DCC1-like thiol-disulfide oxidoreductase family protein [Planctomycetota bacterium]